MDNIVLLKTSMDNSYFYSLNKNTWLHIHPLLAIILEKSKNSLQFEEWKNSVRQKTTSLDSYGSFTLIEFEEQLEKIEFLKKHGYLDYINTEDIRNKKLSKEEVFLLFSNLSRITFEVTEVCNLDCKYCCYGEFYCKNHGLREGKSLPFEKAKVLIDYYSDFLKDNLNSSIYNRNLIVGFYGGEPLLNFDTIVEILNYIRSKDIIGNNLSLSLTTNGVFLDKYYDYLVENDFTLVVSLDGDKDANSYRLHHDGRDSFDIIYKNLKMIQSKYPEFFKKNVFFNSVSHNKNYGMKTEDFFKNEFNKESFHSDLNPSNIIDERKSDFNKMLPFDYTSDEYLKLKYSSSLSEIYEFIKFGYKYEKCYDFFEKHEPDFLTASCIPFSRSIFLTVDGNILYCEKIPHNRPLGYINDACELNLDFKEISDNHNKLNELARKKCKYCYNIKNCRTCLLSNADLVCDDYKNISEMKRYLTDIIESLEINSENIIKEIKGSF